MPDESAQPSASPQIVPSDVDAFKKVLSRLESFGGKAFRNGEPSSCLHKMEAAGLLTLSAEIMAMTRMRTGAWTLGSRKSAKVRRPRSVIVTNQAPLPKEAWSS